MNMTPEQKKISDITEELLRDLGNFDDAESTFVGICSKARRLSVLLDKHYPNVSAMTSAGSDSDNELVSRLMSNSNEWNNINFAEVKRRDKIEIVFSFFMHLAQNAIEEALS